MINNFGSLPIILIVDTIGHRSIGLLEFFDNFISRIFRRVLYALLFTAFDGAGQLKFAQE